MRHIRRNTYSMISPAIMFGLSRINDGKKRYQKATTYVSRSRTPHFERYFSFSCSAKSERTTSNVWVWVYGVCVRCACLFPNAFSLGKASSGPIVRMMDVFVHGLLYSPITKWDKNETVRCGTVRWKSFSENYLRRDEWWRCSICVGIYFLIWDSLAKHKQQRVD